jgi:hypothetical protein
MVNVTNEGANMSATRQHYNLAVENKATQQCDKTVGPSVPKTDFGGKGPGSNAAKGPYRVGKGKNRG